MIFSGSKITFLRGDDDAILVTLADGATFKEGDALFFSLKIDPLDTVDILQIESKQFVMHNDIPNSAALISIGHDDTIDLDCSKKYYYDILIKWADGSYVTIVPPSKFVVAPGGSHD